MGCVYLAKNTVNRKCYVGKTVQDLCCRKRSHEYDATTGSGFYFHSAIRKYGWDAFEWTILTEDDDDEWLRLAEQRWIKRLGTRVPNGYNMTDGGEGILNMPEESRQRQVESNRTRGCSELTRKRIGISVSKLSEDDILVIRNRYASGETCREVARSYCVTTGNILAIVRGESWGWVGGPIGTRKKGPILGRSYPVFSQVQLRRRAKERKARR